MKKILVGGSKPKNTAPPILSYLIRIMQAPHIFQMAKSSHVFTVLEDAETLYHVYFNWAGYESYAKYKETAEIVELFEVQLTDSMYDETTGFMEEYKGKKKGFYKQLFGNFFVQLFRFFGKTIKNPFSDSLDEAVCSEFIHYLMVNFWKWEEATEFDQNAVTDQDILCILEKRVERRPDELKRIV